MKVRDSGIEKEGRKEWMDGVIRGGMDILTGTV